MHGKEVHVKELKQYQVDLNVEYKRSKEDMKKEVGKALLSSSKEKEERVRLGKERLQMDIKQKAEARRKKQGVGLTADVCRLKRKHLVMFHKLEYELLLNVSFIICR